MSSISEARPPALTLEALLEGLVDCSPVLVGDGTTVVSGVTEDSRRARPGTLFVARPGLRTDGSSYVASAMSAGASAVLCGKGSGIEAKPRIEVEDLRGAFGICAQMMSGRPSEGLACIGITGTNGKTTVACIVEQALRHLGRSVGRLGTLGFFLNGEKRGDTLTTPQPDHLAQCLFEAKTSGADSMVLEVSSHAIDQQRIRGVRFTVAAFTNLSQDHLDYHKTMRAYGDTKARLFREYEPAARVINLDDDFGRKLAAEFADVVTVSAGDPLATVFASRAEFTRLGLSATIVSQGGEIVLHSSLIGRHNLENLLVAWGILKCLNVPPRSVADALSAARGVPGRLERCDTEVDDVVVVVDYAHTPDALSRALATLKELEYPEVVCVFGCGGDRDRSKRPLMGAAARAGADRVYLTSDNPRSEDPLAILADVRPGLLGAQFVEEVDRRQAITGAVLSAKPGAVVLIAGKGHEDYQLIGDQVLHFDDREEAQRALSERRQQRRE